MPLSLLLLLAALLAAASFLLFTWWLKKFKAERFEKKKRKLGETLSRMQIRDEKSRTAALRAVSENFEIALTPGKEIRIANLSGLNTRLIKVQLGVRVSNASEYRLVIQQIRWDLWLGPMVKAFSCSPGILLKARNEVEDYIIEDAIPEQDYVDLVRSEDKKKPVGYLEGAAVCKTDFGVFEKKFIGFNIAYDRRGGVGNMVREAQPEHQENLDSLTGFLQRRFIDEQFQTIINSNVPNAPVSFMMIDVDHFKSFNDTHGHIIGDEILKTVCQKIKEVLGGNGMAVRYGGDEFCIILEGIPAAEAEQIAREIHRRVAEAHLKTPQGELQITLSIGVADLQHQAEYQELIKKADKALYESKRKGRNQVTADLRRD